MKKEVSSSFILNDQNELERIITEILKVFNAILIEINYVLPIDGQTRSGAEISNYIERKFVKFVNDNKNSILSEAEQGEGTKSPFDFKCAATLSTKNMQIVYCDIKTAFIKEKRSNSAPDMGSIDKFIKFFKAGNTCFIFIFLKYKRVNNGFEIIKESLRIYPIQYITSSVSVNLKNQLQINFDAGIQKRARKEFLKLLKMVYVKGYQLLLNRTKERLKETEKKFAFVKEQYPDLPHTYGQESKR